MTQSGAMDRRIELGNVKWVTDDEGFQSQEFVPLAKPWAKITNQEEITEINDGKESVNVERVTFVIYFRPGVTQAMMIRFKGKIYEIKGIFNPNFRDVELHLTAYRDNSRKDQPLKEV